MNKQKQYISAINKYTQSLNKKPLACVMTYGCQQNVSDSEKIKGLLQQMGYAFTTDTQQADFILLNTCAVREHAELKIYGNVGALKRIKEKRPDMVIALCGCMMQQEYVQNYIKSKFKHVDMVFGPSLLVKLPEMLHNVIFNKQRIYDRTEILDIVEGVPVVRDEKGKAWVSVMYGCNNFCTYCIVPHVRGRERSRSSSAILEEVQALVNDGYKDITLLGQNVNSYGKDLNEDIDFADLLRKLNDIPGEFWIRFVTSHPKDCTHKLIDTIRDCEKVCNHLQLPVQSGSTDVLTRMNRKYSREDYLSLIRYAKEQIPDIAITSDIIVGFPSETDEQFEETISLIQEVEYDNLFTFIYSKRKGTPAAEMPDQVDPQIQQIRFQKLLDTQTPICKKKNLEYQDKIVKVFAESVSKTDSTMISGHTQSGKKVDFKATSECIGKIVDVKITKAKTWFLQGEMKG